MEESGMRRRVSWKRGVSSIDSIIVLLLLLSALSLVDCTPDKGKIYTNQWVIQVDGGEESAKKVAEAHRLVYVDKVMDGYYLVMHRRMAKRSLGSTSTLNYELKHDRNITWFQQQVAKKRVKRDHTRVRFTDPKWPRMWYLNRGSYLDMNVIPAWSKGYTGKNVVVSILDDGIEKDHPDLKRNYDARASYDVNEHDHDPQPRYEPTNENKHGTRCAGEVAAESNNGICSTGVAFNARIGGVRMLDGDVTDAVEAQSLSLNPNYIHIYSASWGPDDDGRTVDGPGPLAYRAFHDGVFKGRDGLGSIFVWASGNGGQNGDNCNCDGYTNIIYTLSVSSASENGLVPWYSEACPSALATTYSSGSATEKQIVTTDLNKSCTEQHTGTSASAPLAAGICALVLQANPYLTWRDLQHIVVLAAKQANLVSDDWHFNGVGRKVSHHFGFGLMDAGSMVDLAENWTNVPPQKKCEATYRNIPHKGLRVNSKIELSMPSSGCQGSSYPNEKVRYLEHVQIVITLTAQRRGDLEISLTSPSGTRSVMLARRPRDDSGDGFNNWTFMTTHCWGENPVGTWKLEIKNTYSIFFIAQLYRWTLVLYGTSERPYDASTLGLSSNQARHANPGRHWQHSQNLHDVQWMSAHHQGSSQNRNAGYQNNNNNNNRSHYKPGQRSHMQSKIRHESHHFVESNPHSSYSSSSSSSSSSRRMSLSSNVGVCLAVALVAVARRWRIVADDFPLVT